MFHLQPTNLQSSSWVSLSRSWGGEEKGWIIVCNGDAFHRVILVLVQTWPAYLAAVFSNWNTADPDWSGEISGLECHPKASAKAFQMFFWRNEGHPTNIFTSMCALSVSHRWCKSWRRKASETTRGLSGGGRRQHKSASHTASSSLAEPTTKKCLR